MTHTPGPWTADINGDVYGPNHKVIASAYVNDADTHLIAAAPDLLHRLKMITEYAKKVAMYPKDSEGFDPIDMHNLKIAIDKAKEAITKAEGK